MIVGSLLLILVAVVLLVAGLLQGANAMLVASIGASLLAAVALIVGGRRRSAATSAANGSVAHTRARAEAEAPSRARRVERREPVGAGVGGAGGGAPLDQTVVREGGIDDEYATGSIPQQGREGGRRRYADEADFPESDLADDTSDDDGEPADEPAAQQTSPGDSARIARMSAQVIVIDGRPRYHKPGCVHLLSRESEPLPVSEAIELGFTPCAVCEPDSALLAAARRV